jgi:hypothetical protein
MERPEETYILATANQCSHRRIVFRTRYTNKVLEDDVLDEHLGLEELV